MSLGTLSTRVPVLPPLWGLWLAGGDRWTGYTERAYWVRAHIVTARRQRLLACHLSIQAASFLPRNRFVGRRAVAAIETAKLYADGQATRLELSRDYLAAVAAPDAAGAYPAAYAAAIDAVYAAASAAEYANTVHEREAQSCLLQLWIERPMWLPEWCTSSVRGIAQAIYKKEDWQAMPILADAIEDAGCTDETALDWLRSQELQPHFHRGQWALDWCCGYLSRDPTHPADSPSTNNT